MTDINELMERDPLQYKTQDIDEIIAYLRERRTAHLQGDKTAGNLKKKSAQIKEVKPLDLDDL